MKYILPSFRVSQISHCQFPALNAGESNRCSLVFEYMYLYTLFNVNKQLINYLSIILVAKYRYTIYRNYSIVCDLNE